jgi:mannose-6-phosphate isomerase
MCVIYKLKNQVKHYDWGSPKWIPQLLGADNTLCEPWAELWMGVHPGAPSQVSIDSGDGGSDNREITLDTLIARNPRLYLGKEVAEEFGALPFLFKLLAAAKPLSIQAHPSLEQARAGWQRENEQGLAQDAPNRNYKDNNHKPEIICALSPFTAMCGFREPGEIVALMEKFFGTAPRSLQQGLLGLKTALAETAMDKEIVQGTAAETLAVAQSLALKFFLKALFSLSKETRQELTAYIRKMDTAPAKECAPEWENIRRFAELYPGDPGIIAPLYLNLLKLAPGEAVYLNAGVLHAYIDGFGVELMANSDNVLRGGLTPKHVDVDELMQALDFHPLKPEILKPQIPEAKKPKAERPKTSSPDFSRYITPCREFSLAVMKSKGERQAFPGGPAIIIVTQGSVKIIADSNRGSPGENEERVLHQGESAFIPAGETELAELHCRPRPGKQSVHALSFEGDYTLYAAVLPRK